MGRLVMIAICASILSGCAPKLSSIQRRSIEGRDLDGRFEDAFKATLQVFQDHGYIIKSSDYQSGVIQGETGIKKGWWGLMTNSEITATIEQFGENTVKERISIVSKKKSSSQYGTHENSKTIYDPKVFQKLYDDIQKEMFVRANLNK